MKLTNYRVNATTLGAMKIHSGGMDEKVKEIHRIDEFDKEFSIGLISECDNDEKCINSEE